MTDLLAQVAALRNTAQGKVVSDKPRHHTARIMALDTKAERQAALELVPEDIRHIVKFYLMDAWARRNRKPLPDLEKP